MSGLPHHPQRRKCNIDRHGPFDQQADTEADLDAVQAIFERDYSDRFLDKSVRDERSLLSADRSLGSVIKLLTPGPEYTEEHNTLVRSIPAASYLAHFYSDRSHMQGRLPRSAFPDYPIIRPDTAVRRIELAAYRDPHRELRDGSRVTAIDALIAAEARAAVSQPGR